MPTEPNNETHLPELLSEGASDAFATGAASNLVTHRNQQIGNLLTAERAVFYVQILYRMLMFRRNHELEPLYEDIYEAVTPAQNAMADEEYTFTQFRIDTDQLADWEFITCRIEIERLRGYRDTRKRKFRYSLTEECTSFLEWLEERCQEDLENPESDTRDLLEEVCGSLHELLRLLTVFQTKKGRKGDARRALYQLFKTDELSLAINSSLSRFNARLLSFVVSHYEVGRAKEILRDLDEFVDHFLRQIHQLRGEILELVERLLQARMQDKLQRCFLAMEEERRVARHLIRRAAPNQNVEHLPTRIKEFYRESGRLDILCHRIHDAALRVWRKLHAHLREMERRSNRVEDLRDRIRDVASLSPDSVPHAFLRELLSTASMPHDPHYWDDYVRADPPQPRVYHAFKEAETMYPLKRKRRSSGPVVSMQQARLRRLRGWLKTSFRDDPDMIGPRRLSRGTFAEFADFGHIMDLSRAGLLDQGRRLQQIDYQLSHEPGNQTEVSVDDQTLGFDELIVELKTSGKDSRDRDE